MFHPSERYIRIRIWQGLDEDTLRKEIHTRLHLPDAVESTGDLFTPRVLSIVNTSRKKRRVELVRAVYRGKALPKDVPQWLDGRDNSQLTDKEYLRRYKLNTYLGTTCNTVRFFNGLRLWLDDNARELLRGLISSGISDKEAAYYLKKHCPKVFLSGAKAPRPVDIKAVRELFWDLSGMTMDDKLKFLRIQGSCPNEVTAVTCGADAFLFRMRLSELVIDDLERFRTARDVAYLKISEMRARADRFDFRSFNAAYTVMKDASLYVSELVNTQKIDAQESLDRMLRREVQDFSAYDQILRDADRAADEDLIETTLKYEGLTAEEAKVMRAQVARGHLLDFETRLDLQEWLDARLRPDQLEDEFEGELGIMQNVIPLVENETIEELDAKETKVIAKQVGDLDAKQPLTLEAMLNIA
jgi:hypothetical protein